MLKLSRYFFWIFIFQVLIFLVSTSYANSNDLATYNQSIQDGGVYRSDLGFELIQFALIYFVGRENVIYGLQILVLLLATIFILLARKEKEEHQYKIYFLIITSPLVVVGLLNSIRQTIAFLLILIGFKLSQKVPRLFLWVLAVLIHKVALITITLIILTRSFSALKWYNLRMISKKKVYLIVSLVLMGILSSPLLTDLILQVYERYSSYIEAPVVFTDGRVGAAKIMVWLLFWLFLSLFPYSLNSIRKIPKLPVIPILFTFIVLLDVFYRGFSEFHSRIIMINNVLVVLFLLDVLEKNKYVNFYVIIFLAFNFFNPSSIGVLWM